MSTTNVCVVGAGVVGLAYAWSAAERGCRVTVFERTRKAAGASIRNFGMVWPIGQPAGESSEIALLSKQRWETLVSSAGLWWNPCGSIHLAHRADELAVLSEFAARATRSGGAYELLSAADVLRRSPAANPDGLLGGLYSPTEAGVNPPEIIRRIPAWLTDTWGVRFEFETAVRSVNGGVVYSSDGRCWDFDRVIVCGGADCETLYPQILAAAPIRPCKLQMLKTRPQPADFRIGPHLASGLTLRHYRNFEVCPSLLALKQRIAEETPELDRFGIHVMAAQDDRGCVILGDSHEYDEEIEPFDKSLIDELMLRELRKVIDLPDWTIAERWHGIYLKCSEGPIFAAEPEPGVSIRTGTGGSGMTMAFGLAERDWERWS